MLKIKIERYYELSSLKNKIPIYLIRKEYDYVTWSSVVKLINSNSNARLHSHDVKYGTGSGQQSVTAVKSADDHNSYWQIMPAFGVKGIERGYFIFY